MSTKVNNSILSQIAQAAVDGNVQAIRMHLQSGLVSYRLAYLYVEGFLQNKKASELIQKEGICKCGNIAFKWKTKIVGDKKTYKKGLCVSCSWTAAMNKIEYGPLKQTQSEVEIKK